jgi:hypothetical protein
VAAVLHHLGVVQDLRGDYEQPAAIHAGAGHSRELLPPDHPDLAACHNGIGVICNRLATTMPPCATSRRRWIYASGPLASFTPTPPPV